MTMLTKRERRRSDACDVIVVGAGLVGAAVAACLTREGFDTAVLEARRVVGGATGRSLGMALLGLAGHYSWAVSVYGRQRAREIWALTAGGRARLVEIARRLGVPVWRTGSLALAVDDDEANALWESVKLLREDGFDASFSLTDPLKRDFQGALRRPDDVTLDAAALTRALLNAEGVVVHEGTEVYALEPMDDGIRVWAHDRTVICSAVVLAVNGYAALVDPYLAENVAPVRCLVLATEPLGEPFRERACTVDGGKGFLRTLPDGRLLLGRWQRRGPLANGEHLQDLLLDVGARHFPGLDLEGADRWSETMGFTPDGLPLVGRLPSLPQAYFAVGFGGRGLSWAFVVAERLVNHMLHDAKLGLLSAERLADSQTSLSDTR
jgi:glycine/D-amino acid oxidase-like deaminating enzyme